MRISIALRLLLIYLLVAGGFLVVALDGIRRFQSLSDQAYNLSGRDLQAVQVMRDIRAGLVQMERLQRSLPDPPGAAALENIRQSQREFERALSRLDRLMPTEADQIEAGYRQMLNPASGDPAQPLRHGYPPLFERVDRMLEEAEARLREDQRLLLDAPAQAASRLLLIYLFIFVVGLIGVAWLAFRILASLREFRRRVEAIARGEYEMRLPEGSQDELGDMARDLNIMARRLQDSRQLFLDASPLTYLPGNIAIERALMDRLRRNEVFALCYLDLDDFKPFNDHYGYAKGSEVIKATAEVIHQAQRDSGGPRDFVGHIGGDDFVLVTDMDHVHPLCRRVIERFDTMIPAHYTEEDRVRGYIEAKDRFGQLRQFPLMTISIAVVTNANRELTHPVEIARVAAEIKEYVKLLPGSNYLIDRRTQAR